MEHTRVPHTQLHTQLHPSCASPFLHTRGCGLGVLLAPLPPSQGRFYLPACSLPAVPSLPSEPDIYILIFSREAMRCGASVCIVVAHNVK